MLTPLWRGWPVLAGLMGMAWAGAASPPGPAVPQAQLRAAAPQAATPLAGPAGAASAPRAGAGQAPAAAAAASQAASQPAALSASAQRLYDSARRQLVQVRTLLRGQDSQASVGSGFLVGADGLILTNYHVVSQVALQPQRYRLTFAGVDGRTGPLELLAFDAVHDLAVVRPATRSGALPQGLALRPHDQPPLKGERIYSLGNPLDVGFAVVEGTYNGLVERSFFPSIFFSGSLNPGMSGGPALDEEGRVMGINVATLRSGQQVSFLVSTEFAAPLLARARGARPLTEPAWPELARQLTAHQEELTRRFLAQPWRTSGHARYAVPVPQETFMRCWGSSSPAESKGLEFERSDCSMNTSIFVSSAIETGNIDVRHETYDGGRLGPWRFARQYSQSFRNEYFGGGRQRTAPRCAERYVDRAGLPLRAVICLNAYNKLPGLYDVGVLVTTVDAATGGAQGRLDARGVSYANALKLADHYLQGFGWTRASKSATAPAARPSR